jgi:peptidoglycan/xylan/chitin deacetylase (PgdA/CDA1 family)
LRREKIKGSFFFTGDFFRNPAFTKTIAELKKNKNLIGPHSDKHLLYCDWTKRDSLLVSKEVFSNDLLKNYNMMSRFGLNRGDAPYFLPPYEWYNDSISNWCNEAGIQLINYTPGTLSHADYTTSKDRNYRSSEMIYKSILDYERSKPAGLSGFILLMHIGAGPDRVDKFYARLPQLIKYLKQKGYHFQRVDQLLKPD